MKLTETELAQLYNQHTAQHPPAGCPSAENLTRAAMGELNSSEREQTASHLGLCPTCSEEYQLILSLKPWAAQAAARIQPAAAEIPRQVIIPQPSWLDWLRSIFTIPALPYAAAAMLLLVTSFLAYKLISVRQEKEQLIASARSYEEQVKGTQTTIGQVNDELQRTRQQLDETNRKAQLAEAQIAELQRAAEQKPKSDELAQPQFNVPIIDLAPQDTRGQIENATKKIEVPAGVNFVTLILNINGQPNFSDYALEILDRQGKTVYQGRGLKKNAENSFTIAISRSQLASGQYQFKLYGIKQGQQTLVQDYLVQLRYQ